MYENTGRENMRCPLLLCLGLHILLQGHCLEFVIDGEREDEVVRPKMVSIPFHATEITYFKDVSTFL